MALAASTLTLFGDIASGCGYTSTEAGLASGLFMIGVWLNGGCHQSVFASQVSDCIIFVNVKDDLQMICKETNTATGS